MSLSHTRSSDSTSASGQYDACETTEMSRDDISPVNCSFTPVTTLEVALTSLLAAGANGVVGVDVGVDMDVVAVAVAVVV